MPRYAGCSPAAALKEASETIRRRICCVFAVEFSPAHVLCLFKFDVRPLALATLPLRLESFEQTNAVLRREADGRAVTCDGSVTAM
jgi:hypothetical protein